MAEMRHPEEWHQEVVDELKAKVERLRGEREEACIKAALRGWDRAHEVLGMANLSFDRDSFEEEIRRRLAEEKHG